MPRTRATARPNLSRATTMLVVFAASCGTIDNQFGFWESDAQNTPTVMVYGGLAADVEWAGLLFSGERWRDAGVLVMLPLWAFDVPLSIVADTVLLPMTVVQQVWLWVS